MVYFADLKIKSPADEDVNAEVSFVLDVRLEICHFKVIVNPVDNEIGEPGILSLTFKQTTEKFETILSEIVSKDFERH